MAASSPATAASWRCCPSIRCSAGWRGTCSPAGTASSIPTKPSPTSSTRCSTSTPSGWTSAKNHVSWRAPVASENILLSSTVWRQDHNGFSHQDPGFIDLVTNKGPSVTRVYLPPDANTLLAVADHCLRSTDCINVIVADKQKHLQFADIDEAITHCAKGLGIWARASTDAGEEPDVVLASCGDVATMEALAAAAILRERAPDLKLRFVNVVDLFKLQPVSEHPHGSTEREFDGLFTTDKPIIFNFHGYPWLIHRLAYRFKGHDQPACARLQGEGQHQHAARAGDAERDVALPPGHRRDRSRADAAKQGGTPEGGDEERHRRQLALCPRARHRPAPDCRLGLAVNDQLPTPNFQLPTARHPGSWDLEIGS